MLSNYKQLSVISDAHNVYLVKDLRDDNLYVCKWLSLYNDDVYSILNDSDFPGVPRIHEIIKGENVLIVVEEYLRGCTLEEKIELKSSLGQTFSESEAISYVLELCELLEPLHAHCPAIVHRDLKPTNIMVLDDGRLNLIDFNAAKFESELKSEDTVLLGTKGYAAPEQYGFGTSGVRTDIYAIGVLFNELVSGTASRTCPSEFSAAPVINRCTDLKYENRYSSLSELKAALLSLNDPGAESHEKNSQIGTKTSEFSKNSFLKENPLKLSVSILMTAVFLFISFNLQIQGSSGAMLTFERISTFIALMLCLAFSMNAGAVQHAVRLDLIRNKFVRALVILFADLIIIFIVYTLMVLLERVAM